MASDIDRWAFAIVLHNVPIFFGNSPERPPNSRSYANHSLACALDRPLPNDAQRDNILVVAAACHVITVSTGCTGPFNFYWMILILL